MNYVLFDLDNCLSNDEWRLPRIAWGKTDMDARFHDYHSLSAFDAPANLEVLRSCVNQYHANVIISTARSVLYRAITEHWLKLHGIPCDFLLMRNINDHRSSAVLKTTHLFWLDDLYDVPISAICAAFDDRLDVVEMYRAIGIKRAEVLCAQKTTIYAPEHGRVN